MIISIIAAMSQNRVIGSGGEVPWNLPDDLEWLKERIAGHYLLMGRKTYEEPQQELKNQKTIVVTRQKNYNAGPSRVVNDIDSGLALARQLGEEELFVVGGAGLYEQALPYAHALYITQINAHIAGDTFFPELDKNKWHTIYTHYHPEDKWHAYEFEFKVLYSTSYLQSASAL